VRRIISFYVFINPIKILCPFCYKDQSNKEPCSYCGVKSPEEELKDDS